MYSSAPCRNLWFLSFVGKQMKKWSYLIDHMGVVMVQWLVIDDTNSCFALGCRINYILIKMKVNIKKDDVTSS